MFYLGSLVQFSPATGRAGRCRQMSLCVGHTGFAPLTGVCAFPVYTAQAPGCSTWNGPCAEYGSSFRVLHKSTDSVAPACCVFPALAVRQPEAWAPSPRVWRAFSLRGERLRQPGACAPSPWVRGTFSLCGERPRQPEAWAPSSGARRAFSLRGPSACAAGLVSGSL